MHCKHLSAAPHIPLSILQTHIPCVIMHLPTQTLVSPTLTPHSECHNNFSFSPTPIHLQQRHFPRTGQAPKISWFGSIIPGSPGAMRPFARREGIEEIIIVDEILTEVILMDPIVHPPSLPPDTFWATGNGNRPTTLLRPKRTSGHYENVMVTENIPVEFLPAYMDIATQPPSPAPEPLAPVLFPFPLLEHSAVTTRNSSSSGRHSRSFSSGRSAQSSFSVARAHTSCSVRTTKSSATSLPPKTPTILPEELSTARKETLSQVTSHNRRDYSATSLPPKTPTIRLQECSTAREDTRSEAASQYLRRSFAEEELQRIRRKANVRA